MWCHYLSSLLETLPQPLLLSHHFLSGAQTLVRRASSLQSLSDARPPVSDGVRGNPARLLLEAFASLLGWSVTFGSYVLGPPRRGIAS